MSPNLERLFDLRGRTALVTGSGRGLGFEIAKTLGMAGAKVAINGRRMKSLHSAIDALHLAGIDAVPFEADVRHEPERLLREVTERMGRLDILVHNVGQRDRRATPDLPEEDFRQLLQINLVSAYALSRCAIERLANSDLGRLIFVTSVAGPLARPGDPAYTAAKGGLAALMRSLAVEFGAKGLTANAIAPGWFKTEANAGFIGDPSIEEYIERRIPAKRWGEPAEIGAAALFLSSPAASYVNGLTLTVDGGLSVAL